MKFCKNLFGTEIVFPLTLEKSFIIVFHRFLPKNLPVFQILGISLNSDEIWPATAETLVHYRNIFVRRARELIFWLQVAIHKSSLHAKYFRWALLGRGDMELQSLVFQKLWFLHCISPMVGHIDLVSKAQIISQVCLT